jgi:hypothetical protein
MQRGARTSGPFLARKADRMSALRIGTFRAAASCCRCWRWGWRCWLEIQLEPTWLGRLRQNTVRFRVFGISAQEGGGN